jgi:SAM-dependent methyltransferase
MSSAYDAIAEMYDSRWDGWYLPEALPALSTLFFHRVHRGARVLEVCCGSGHVTSELIARGYNVTGVDNSAGLLRLGRAKMPQLDLVLQDVRKLALRPVFDAALSTFDSLNHILELDELVSCLKCVRSTLKPGGLFVFDVNDEEAYRMDLSRWQTTVDSDRVLLVRGTYDPSQKLGATELVSFARQGGEVWQRQRTTVLERCYDNAQITNGLSAAGFFNIDSRSAAELGVTSELGVGRTYFSAIA